jgi:hypothetical protein
MSAKNIAGCSSQPLNKLKQSRTQTRLQTCTAAVLAMTWSWRPQKPCTFLFTFVSSCGIGLLFLIRSSWPELALWSLCSHKLLKSLQTAVSVSDVLPPSLPSRTQNKLLLQIFDPHLITHALGSLTDLHALLDRNSTCGCQERGSSEASECSLLRSTASWKL